MIMMTFTRFNVASALALFSVLVIGVPGLSVSGNKVLDAAGKPVLLRGVDRPSLEWSTQGESLSLSDYQLMKNKWNANVVRLSLNQDFWFAGSAYQSTVDQQVTWIQQVGMYVILDLHWSDPTNSGSAGQQNMADRYSINFWSQVAAKYKSNLNVLFELYNEPHDISWSAWLNGDGGNFVGMQQLYNAVRAAGAQNIVIVNGIDWAYDLSGIGNGYALSGTNIMYSTHPYNFANKLAANWNSGFLYLAATYPVIMTEFGQYCANDGYVQALLLQANVYGIHWTAWAWYVSGCGFPSIISDWSGTPSSPVGQIVQAFLLQGGNATAGPVGGSTTTGGSTTGSGSPTSAPPATNGVIIYDDALQNSWQDWSWATHSLLATPAHSGSSSISFNLDQTKAIYFHVPSPFYPGTFNSVQFWINGGSSSGQSIYVQVYDTSATPVPIGYQIFLPVPAAANSWVQEIILFSSFGLASNQQISGFVIVASTSSNTVYVDDVSLQPVGQATSAPSTTAATAVPTTVKITAAPTTVQPTTTAAPTTTSIPSTARATTPAPTPTTSIPTTVKSTTSTPTTPAPTTTSIASTAKATTSTPTTAAPTTIVVTTSAPTTTAAPATTAKPTAAPTTQKPATTQVATTKKPTAAPTTKAPTTTAAPATTAAPTAAPVATTPAPVATTQAPSQGCSATVVQVFQSTSTAQLTITNTGLLPVKQLLFTIVGTTSGSWNIVQLPLLQNTFTIPDWAINQLTPGSSANQYGYNYQGQLPTVTVVSVSC